MHKKLRHHYDNSYLHWILHLLHCRRRVVHSRIRRLFVPWWLVLLDGRWERRLVLQAQQTKRSKRSPHQTKGDWTPSHTVIEAYTLECMCFRVSRGESLSRGLFRDSRPLASESICPLDSHIFYSKMSQKTSNRSNSTFLIIFLIFPHHSIRTDTALQCQ